MLKEVGASGQISLGKKPGSSEDRIFEPDAQVIGANHPEARCRPASRAASRRRVRTA